MTVLTGDCRALLATLPAGSVQCCVTSPPYFGLRDYGHAGQLGLEATPDAYVAALVDVFRAVRRVLRDDGTVWLNLGDSYSTKDLLMIPARVALALQADGWWLRSDIIWHKPNPMPESVTDRPTSAHEHVFLLTKRERYFYDAEAIKEPCTSGPSDLRKMNAGLDRIGGKAKLLDDPYNKASAATGIGRKRAVGSADGRNARSVWSLGSSSYKGAHFATMPPALAERCMLAGSRSGDLVLDPFGGAGTTGMVAKRLNRRAVLLELNPDYAELARDRIERAPGPQPDLLGAAGPNLGGRFVSCGPGLPLFGSTP